ncbi:ATPase, T2SS/T4P/T4SS family [Limnohabitans sp.]|uniref:GspE/PulE family protein n=1 Tax=Limnohabitans sp. TaxID=1907725 RepID=UPI00286F2B2F|nr:ATPase, T2SS/T4P/T4SS family [Limnohabitans sp.]
MSVASIIAPGTVTGQFISNFKDVPTFSNLLTHGHEAVTTVPKEKERTLVALGLQDKGYFLLCMPEEQNKVAWFALRERLKARGYLPRGHATCSEEVMNVLLRDVGRVSKETARQIEEDAEVVSDIVNESQPIGWFRDVLASCINLGATDLHFELRGNRAMVRVRLDGLMRELTAVPYQIALDGISAVYNIIAEERSRSEGVFNQSLAQQAMIPFALGSETVNLRFQSHPAVSGMDVIMRILRTNKDNKKKLSLDTLGYTPSQIDALQTAVGSSWGGIFIAGITGSGKTTTLNTLLTQLAQEGNRKIVSIEDPVEYHVNGVSHLSIQRSVNGDESANPFKGAMMAFLRMDPDVGMFGEIRDEFSAEMALGAIQTGHKILTTVHATSALGVVDRLTSKALGLLRDNVCNPEFLSALVYQVLTPINCPSCKVRAMDVMSPAALIPYQTIFGLDVRDIYCASDCGCDECLKPNIDYSNSKHAGVKGVKVSAEVILPDEDMFLLLKDGKDIEARKAWRAKRTAKFNEADMTGKEAWGHALYDMSRGLIDPYYFEMNFGLPKLFAPKV